MPVWLRVPHLKETGMLFKTGQIGSADVDEALAPLLHSGIVMASGAAAVPNLFPGFDRQVQDTQAPLGQPIH